MGDSKDKPCFLQPIRENIPLKLKERPQWVVWKGVFEPDKTKKWAKVPFNAKTGKQASSTDPDTWSNFNTAYYKYKKSNSKYDGIGFALYEKDPFTGWDFDNCRNSETGTIEPWAQKFINRLNSYTEVSPSGTGIRVFVIAELPASGRKKGDIEVYNSGRYLTVTGHIIP